MQQWETTADLPAGWRQSRTPTGRIYYLNDTTRTTQWEWPGLPGPENPPAALPAGWREAFDAEGRINYVNDTARATRWERPSQPSRPILPSLHPPQQPSPPPLTRRSKPGAPPDFSGYDEAAKKVAATIRRLKHEFLGGVAIDGSDVSQEGLARQPSETFAKMCVCSTAQTNQG